MEPRTQFLSRLTVLALLPAIVLASPDDAELEKGGAAKALPVIAQRLLDALPGDSLVWKRYLSERATFVDEGGDIASKAELLPDFRPFPPGITGSIRIENPRVEDFGDFATLVFEARERQTVFGQSIEVGYRTSQTWSREHGKWRLVLWHNLVLARDPTPTPIPAARLAGYEGVYELGERRYRVVARGDSLFGGPEGREPAPLIAVGDNVFAEAGSKLGILRIFLPGEHGGAMRMVQRRKYADIVWTRAARGITPSPGK